jgi:hypothetical protein
MRIGTGVAVLLFAAAPVCAAAEGKAFAALDGTFWRLETPPPGLERLSIGFHDGMLMETAPCEHSVHEFALENGRLAFRGLLIAGSNFAAQSSYAAARCEREFEATNPFDEQLSQTVQVERKGNQLALLDDKRAKSAFVQITSNDFEYRLLTVDSYRDEASLVRVLATRGKPTLLFASGQIIGRCGYPFWNASYARTGDTTIRIATSLEAVSCPDDALAQQQERGIAGALGKAHDVHAAAGGGGFELRDAHGDVEVVLSPIHRRDQP